MIKRILIIILVNISLSICTNGQIRFNKRVVIDSLPKVITSIYPTDSCYYGIGVVSDSINLLSFGNSFYKFDLEGNLLFEKRLTNPHKSFEAWGQIKKNKSEELVTFGYSQDTSTIHWKSWFVKYNTNGDTILTKHQISPNYNTTGDPFFSPLDFLVTPDSGYIFIATTASNTLKDIAVVKLNKNGEEEWSKTYGNVYDDVVYNIIHDGDNYIICGTTNLNNQSQTSTISSLYLFSIDSIGNQLWSYVAPQEEDILIAHDIVKTNDGGYIIPSAIKTGIINNNDYYVGSTLKLDSNFDVEWHNPIFHAPASSINYLYDIVETEIDTAFTVWGIQHGFNDTTWGIQPWLAKVSIDGDSLWSRSYTFLGLAPHFRHQFFDVRSTFDGGYIMCGESIDFSPDGSGDGAKGWLLKVDKYGCIVPECHLNTSTEYLEKQYQFVIKTYPNPTSDFLNIYFKHQQNREDGLFRLIDLNGRVLLEFNADRNETTYIIDVEKYSNGIYFLQYFQNGIPVKSNQIIISR
jgi:hypothetical protein